VVRFGRSRWFMMRGSIPRSNTQGMAWWV